MPFAKRSLGQNFLADPNTARRIVTALDIGPEDRVLEIGPGRGALTEWIVAAGPGRFVALEKDRDLAEALRERWPGIEVRTADALDYPWEELDHPSWKVVGNLPYNIASPLLWDLVSRAGDYGRAVCMVQYEVALRLAASPGGRDYGGLSVWVQTFASVDLLFKVGPSVFRPRPKVDSAVVRLLPKKNRPSPEDAAALSQLLRLCFQKRRKQMSNILKSLWNTGAGEWFKDQGIAGEARPEILTPDQFLSLSRAVSRHIFA